MKARWGKKNDKGTAMKKTILVAYALIASGTAAAQTLEVTSGTMTVEAFAPTASFTFAGNGFSGGGTFDFPVIENPLNFPVAPGPYQGIINAGNLGNGLGAGVSGTAIPPGPNDGEGEVLFDNIGSVVITGPGTFSGPFTFSASFNTPDQFCPECVGQYFSGSGVTTINVVPDPVTAGALLVTQETFTFVPEPGTLALFAFGLVGVVTRRKAVAPLPKRLGNGLTHERPLS
jgi:hypothetical protein